MNRDRWCTCIQQGAKQAKDEIREARMRGIRLTITSLDFVKNMSIYDMCTSCWSYVRLHVCMYVYVTHPIIYICVQHLTGLRKHPYTYISCCYIHLVNLSWVDILVFWAATLCAYIVEEILVKCYSYNKTSTA